MNGKNRSDIEIGALVEIVEKANQSSGELSRGYVEKILTNAKFHPHGIKVKLESGEIGRVKTILEED